MSDEAVTRRVSSITLMLGAGVSAGIVPAWEKFTDAVMDHCSAPERPKSRACERLPNDNQARLELAWRHLQHDAATRVDGKGRAPVGARMLEREAEVEQAWIAALRTALYSLKPGSFPAATSATRPTLEVPETLDAIVELLTDPGRREVVRQVVTFNADDWLEHTLVARLPGESVAARRTAFRELFRIVTQPTYGADSLFVQTGDPTVREALPRSARRIPIIHAHGMLVIRRSNRKPLRLMPPRTGKAGCRRTTRPTCLCFATSTTGERPVIRPASQTQ